MSLPERAPLRAEQSGSRIEQIGDWEVRVGPEVTLGADSNLEPFLQTSLDQFVEAYNPPEDQRYFFHSQFGLPSPIVRFDMPLEDGEVGGGIYEIESRPAGLAIVSHLQPELLGAFRGSVEQIQGITGKQVAIKMLPYEQSSQNDPSGEKRMFADMLGVPFVEAGEQPEPDPDSLYLVYGNSSEAGDDVKAYEGQSLFPVRNDGDKSYLVTMGRATFPTPDMVDQALDANQPFILKPGQGMWAQDFFPYVGSGNKAKGRVTASKIRSLYRDQENDRLGEFIMQPFIPPGKIEFPGYEKPQNAMARVYAVADLATGTYNVVGGMYVARDNLRLHGTSDATTGNIGNLGIRAA